MNWIVKIASYLFPITLKTYTSAISGEIYIVAENGKKVLNTNLVNYSFSSLHRIFKESFKKTKLSIQPNTNILMLGLGAGSIVHIIREDYRSNATITAIELDPVIIEIARNEFNIGQYEPIHIIESDALQYINQVTQKFDVICVDLFVQDKVPEIFLSADFIHTIVSILTTGGKIYFNFMDCSAELTNLFDQRIKELQAAHQILSSIEVLRLEENNRVLVVTK